MKCTRILDEHAKSYCCYVNERDKHKVDVRDVVAAAEQLCSFEELCTVSA